MKRITFSCALSMAITLVVAQPTAFKYQTLVRDTSGMIMSNQNVSFHISIVQDSINGTVIYTEDHNTITNEFGLANLEIGNGTPVVGTFGEIDWGREDHFLEIHIDLAGGSNFIFAGKSQLLSVPYSAFSFKSNSIAVYTSDERNVIQNPQPGMQILNSTTNCMNYFDGNNWFELCGAYIAIIPLITTSPVTEITQTTAVCGGEVVQEGHTPVISRGIVWSTSEQPTIFNNEGMTSEGTGLGFFISYLNNLESETIYYARAYAENNQGVGYGEELTFSTLSSTAFVCGISSVYDFDGNVYNTVQIGTQCWLKENLKTTHYKNGVGIEYPADNNTWNNNTTGAYTWYNKDISWKDYYGALYNWYALLNNNGLCPEGWHTPNYTEWSVLINYSGGFSSPNGNKLKSCRQIESPLGGDCNTILHPRWEQYYPHYGTDDFGFSALPGGSGGVAFQALGYYGYWWTTDEYQPGYGWYILLDYSTGNTLVNSSNKTGGFSVRCLKD